MSEQIKITSEHFNTVLHGLNRSEEKLKFLKDSLDNSVDYTEVVGNTLHLVLHAIETKAQFITVPESDMKSLHEIGAFGGME